MKNKLLPLLFVLGASGVYGQVGIGTSLPNASSQLEIVASDRGILIPRLALTSTTDVTTITNGNINSLLVFNTATVADIKPGYYYWFDDRWNKIVVSSDLLPSQANVIFNPVTNQFTYIDNTGNIQNINFEEIVQANETVTTLVDNGNGTLSLDKIGYLLSQNKSYKGIFPCFRFGKSGTLFSSMLNALISFLLVSCGKITSSINPRSAARYGVANFSAYSVSFSKSFAAGSSADEISFLKIISLAPLAPITAISAEGQAKFISAPMCLEFITS